jgi:hypothetical protein
MDIVSNCRSKYPCTDLLLRLAVCAVLEITFAGCGRAPEAPPPQQRATPPAAAVFHGSLDGTTGEYICGWAWEPTRPDQPVTVAISDGKTLLGETWADSPRKDLAEKKIGTGKYGFAFPIPKGLRDGKKHQIHARIQATNAELANSPMTFPSGAGK